jgi:site-specific recombinase XerD
MGRHTEGWSKRQRAPGHAWAVRFTHNGVEYERSTGTSDAEEASRECARIYADIVRRSPARRPRKRSALSLEELIAAWLVDLTATHDPETVKTWTVYGRHFVRHFAAPHHVTEGMCEEYVKARLRAVRAQTVRKELSALRSFIGWAKLDVTVAPVPERATGTAHPVRRRSAAVQVSPAEAKRIIAKLPAWSESKRVKRFPIRSRFLVGYETGLRPSTLDLLSAPEHYRKGQAYIRLTADVDKNAWAREVPLSKAARAALDRVCPKKGPIFGAHDYRPHVAAAANAVLSADRAARFTAAHLRSARITHLLEATGNLPGVQFLVGHKLATTTNAYSRPSERAALAVLGRLRNSRETGRPGTRQKLRAKEGT